jgi:molybdate transport system ATP-binding protein
MERVGVVVYEPPVDGGAVLNVALALLMERGVSVGGLRQRVGEKEKGRRASMWVDHLETGRTVRIDQPRGPGARACVLDPEALAEAAGWLRETVESRPAVIAVNRFGHAESEGDGMRGELADAILSGAVVVLAVRRGLLPDLVGFLGEEPVVLPSDPEAVVAWVEARCAVGVG